MIQSDKFKEKGIEMILLIMFMAFALVSCGFGVMVLQEQGKSRLGYIAIVLSIVLTSMTLVLAPRIGTGKLRDTIHIQRGVPYKVGPTVDMGDYYAQHLQHGTDNGLWYRIPTSSVDTNVFTNKVVVYQRENGQMTFKSK